MSENTSVDADISDVVIAIWKMNSTLELILAILEDEIMYQEAERERLRTFMADPADPRG